jgi:hypothetical protein
MRQLLWQINDRALMPAFLRLPTSLLARGLGEFSIVRSHNSSTLSSTDAGLKKPVSRKGLLKSKSYRTGRCPDRLVRRCRKSLLGKAKDRPKVLAIRRKAIWPALPLGLFNLEIGELLSGSKLRHQPARLLSSTCPGLPPHIFCLSFTDRRAIERIHVPVAVPICCWNARPSGLRIESLF